jgi:phosphinothricin acetyltransferase
MDLDGLRDATPDDLPEVVAIYNATVAGRTATADTEPVSVASRRAWFDEHGPERRPLWVLPDEQGICAWVSFSDFYGRPAYGATAEVSIYLADRAQGRRLGSALLDEAIRRAPGLGLTTLLGFVFSHNVASLRMLDRAGFARWGHLPDVAVLDGRPVSVDIVGLRV